MPKKSLTIVLVVQKTHFWKIWKKQFWGFTPKPLPTSDRGAHHWKEREKYNHKQTTVETFRTFLVYFLSTFCQICVTL